MKKYGWIQIFTELYSEPRIYYQSQMPLEVYEFITLCSSCHYSSQQKSEKLKEDKKHDMELIELNMSIQFSNDQDRRLK